MPSGFGSLQAGRNTRPLTEREVQKVVSTFYSFDREANIRYEAASRTLFVPVGEGDVNHEIIIGPDVYPGVAIADPNASLSMRCAVAHELTHKSRHDDLTELVELELEHIDEALTSLGAFLRYQTELSAHEMRELVSDAIQRLQLYVNSYRALNEMAAEDIGAA